MCCKILQVCTSVLYVEPGTIHVPYSDFEVQFNLAILAELFWSCKEMGDVEGVEDEEEGEDGGVDVEVPLGPGPLQVDERRNHWVTDQPEEKKYVYVITLV